MNHQLVFGLPSLLVFLVDRTFLPPFLPTFVERGGKAVIATPGFIGLDRRPSQRGDMSA